LDILFIKHLYIYIGFEGEEMTKLERFKKRVDTANVQLSVVQELKKQIKELKQQVKDLKMENDYFRFRAWERKKER
jgi:lipoate-protein ligase B